MTVGPEGEEVVQPRDGDDEATVRRRLEEGYTSAFEEQVARYAPMLRRFAEERLPARLWRRVSAADVLQEAHLVAHDRRHEFQDRGESSLRNWLLKIVELKVREAVRRHEGAQRRAVGREEPRGTFRDPSRVAGRGPTPSQAAIGNEMIDRAWRALLELPEAQREIVRLVRDEDLTLAQVAERQGMTREATKKAYGRARAPRRVPGGARARGRRNGDGLRRHRGGGRAGPAQR